MAGGDGILVSYVSILLVTLKSILVPAIDYFRL